MNPIDKTAPQQTEAIAFEFDLPHPPEKVWRAQGKLESGTAFVFQTQPYPGLDGTVHCRMLEIELHKKLSYTWVGGEMLDTVVTFALTATAAGTRVLLVQSGFKPEQKQNFGGARYGWKMMGGKLVDLLTRIA